MPVTGLQQLLEGVLERAPTSLALLGARESLTYRALADAAAAVAAGLHRQGVNPGDRVAWQLPNGEEALVLSLACYRIGAISVPVHQRFTPAEITALVELVTPRLVVLPAAEVLADTDCAAAAGDRLVPWPDLLGAEPLPAVNGLPEDHPALILFTSGSTGHPKAVVHSHRGCLAAIDSCRQALAFSERDVVLVGKPLSHAGGLHTQLLPSLQVGARVLLATRPSPETAVSLINRHGVTEYGLLASDLLDFVDYLEASGVSLPSLRLVIGSGDTVPIDLQHRFQALFGWPVLEGCGLTEVGSYYAIQPLHGTRHPGSIGRAAPGVELRILSSTGTEEVPVGSIGEVAIRTSSATLGYWRNPAATEALFRDGWLLSGDLAQRDADGTFWYRGRRKLVIVRRGSNVHPTEVEEQLDAHPAVHAAVVVGVPHPRDGAVPVAWIQPNVVGEPVDGEVLGTWLAGRLAAYKRPITYLPIDALPRNSAGKFDRALLQQRAIKMLAVQ